MSEIQDRLSALRSIMREKKIDLVLVPTADCHESEYVGEYFKERVFITGFTGSAGTAVIAMDEAALWTDGRYFIQAERQLQGSGVTLQRMQQEGVPTVTEFIEEHLPEGGTLGFDGSVINHALAKQLKRIAEKKNGSIASSEDLVGMIWNDRPARSAEKVWELEEKYSGESRASKLTRIRKEMNEKGADFHIVSDLTDIAWMLNIRGGDIAHLPVCLAFFTISEEDAALYVQTKALPDEIRRSLEADGVSVREYEEIYELDGNRLSEKTILLNEKQVNTRICSLIPKTAAVMNEMNPATRMKALKNETEQKNIRNAHVKDGVAMVKFLYWLKKNVGTMEMTEITAQDYLADRRAEQEGFLDLSFGTISAYNANAAMMHYSAKPGQTAELKPEGFLLVDSGGHYLEGSTDITRTIVLGPVPEAWKHDYTLVLQSNLRLANAKFLYGCTGQSLDILAREPIWKESLDYQCGTGHGIGYLLNIHEGPNSFRWRPIPGRENDAVLEEGMITTDEPGIYTEGSHGIRTENELLCKKADKNFYGQFMEFETITYCPIDLDAVDLTMLSNEEKGWLNSYHKLVFETLSPYFEGEELEFLKKETREV